LIQNPGIVQWKKDNVAGFLIIHALAALALVPWFFSWTAVLLFVSGLFVFGMCGINLGYHRLLAHRGLACPLWLERVFATLAVCAAQDSPPHWIAVHRRHHQFADEPNDPHSPLVNIFWAHMGWLLVKKEDMARAPLIERYAKDIVRDPYYRWLELNSNWIKIALLSWLFYFVTGAALMTLGGGERAAAGRFGLSLLVWGAALRTVVVWHATWAVNSVTHVWGTRRYDTADASRNNTLVAVLTSGEGWHNNHHADARSARHGHAWWELDLTWLTIRLLRRLGLATRVVLPAPRLTAPPANRSTTGPPGPRPGKTNTVA
jgi:fatty-acid desaturase